MARYLFVAVIVSGVVALALAGWTIRGARKLASPRLPRPILRPAFA